MKNPFDVVRDFEQAVAEYTGAPYCVAVNSCTNALFLCLAYQRSLIGEIDEETDRLKVEIPKHTYVSVPMQIIHAGFDVAFRDQNWSGGYNLAPFSIYDCARRFTSNMFLDQQYYGKHSVDNCMYQCISFHWSKILGIQQGGAILHNDLGFDIWARQARFDGRTEGVAPKDDNLTMLGWHMYMSPEIAAEGLVRLHHLPKNNPDLPNSDYPDLSQMEIFK